MPLHRLAAVTYLGGLPGTHDRINDPAANGDAGASAPADGKKGSGANEGTYFVAFAEDGTSSNANRSASALAENTDFLDNVVSGEAPVVDNLDVVGTGAVATTTITGDIFVGKSGTSNNQLERNRLIKVLDSDTGNDLIDASGNKVQVSLIHNGAAANQVGVPATGFYTNPTVDFSPAIPASSNYRLVFARRSSLVDALLNKTRLDAMTREVIQGSHQTSAEIVRWVREAGRRSGGQLQSLVGTILETPGLGENLLAKANSITMDIDPDESTAFNGSFDVRFHRDGTPKSLLKVLEGASAGTSEWRNTAERIALSDVNTLASGFGATLVPFSSGVSADGDDQIRLMGVDPGATPVSVLKRLNAAPYITCGDGVTSFGDFNGVTALTDAVAYAASEGIEGLHIILKHGVYSASGLDLDTGTGGNVAHHVIIEGVVEGFFDVGGPVASGVIINNTALLGATAAALTCGGELSRIEFRNIKFAKGSTSELAWYSESCVVSFNNCRFTNQSIRCDVGRDLLVDLDESTAGSNLLEVRDCFLELETGSSTTPPLQLSLAEPAAGSSSCKGALVEDCKIVAVDEVPACLLANLNMTVPGTLGNILFNRCVVTLGGTATNSGNLNNNSGALALSLGTTNKGRVKKIEWRQCTVTADKGALANNILLYLRDDDGVGAFTVETVKLSGGRWEFMESSEINPFNVISEAWEIAGAAKVVVEDVLWGGVEAGPYGDAPTEITGAPALAGWGCFTIAATTIVMKNVVWLGGYSLSGSGDLLCAAYNELSVDGVHIKPVSGNWAGSVGSGTAPEFRIKFDPADVRAYGNMTVNGLTFGKVIGTDNEATEGIVVVVPISTFEPSTAPFTLRNCHLSGSLLAAGIYVDGATDDRAGHLHIQDCRIHDMNGSGFLYVAGGVSDAIIKNHRITNCYFSSCDLGIEYRHAVAVDMGDVTISGCVFEDNADKAISFDVTQWGNDSLGIFLQGNKFDNNNAGIAAIQVSIGGTDARGAAYGNISRSTPDEFTPGSLSITPSSHFKGTETGYTYSGSGGTIITTAIVGVATANRRGHTADLMIHNHMRWIA